MFQEIITYSIILLAVMAAFRNIWNLMAGKKSKCSNCASSGNCELQKLRKTHLPIKNIK